MDAEAPGPVLHERFTVTYPSGTALESYYPGGATLREVEVTHPLAVVEVGEDPRVVEEVIT